MKEVIFYSIVGTIAFVILNSAWIWLLVKAEAVRTRETQVQPAAGIMAAAFQLEASGD